MFHFKDRLPLGMRSSVIYEFRCTQGCVPVSYVGSTRRHLFDRASEHAGRSARTGKPLSIVQSNVFDHSQSCSCSINVNSFSVLSSCRNDIDLRILESLYILNRKPVLNDHQSSFPLLIA